MRFGYTICDHADIDVYHEAAEFISEQLGFTPNHDEAGDVDGTIWQSFSKGNSEIRLESDAQINYVAIISDVELPIECVYEFEAA